MVEKAFQNGEFLKIKTDTHSTLRNENYPKLNFFNFEIDIELVI